MKRPVNIAYAVKFTVPHLGRLLRDGVSFLRMRLLRKEIDNGFGVAEVAEGDFDEAL